MHLQYFRYINDEIWMFSFSHKKSWLIIISSSIIRIIHGAFACTHMHKHTHITVWYFC